jgi:mannose-6-phosphate isomerase-like protein (cupin superfamily)
MPVDVFKEHRNPVIKESFRCISNTEDAYTMEWTVTPGGYVPFAHTHERQTETFTVIEGQVKMVINKKETIVHAGESITVPPKTIHIAYNESKESLRCIVSYSPSLDMELFDQCFLGLTADGYQDKKGGVHIPRMGFCIYGMKALARPANIPAPVFRITLFLFYCMGKIAGWNRFYKKYTGLSK